MGYETKLEGFEGPLDLLLHLIKESKVDIHEVKISEIAQQYLAYIRGLEELKLEVASEYLVMASQLILIKSRKLLPKEEVLIDDTYEDDPEAQLIERLLEYQRYKASLDAFRALEANRHQYYTKPPVDFTQYMNDVQINLNLDPNELILAFEKLLRRQRLITPMPTTILSEKVTIASRTIDILKRLNAVGCLKLSQLFDRFDKEYVVVTFLAILELAKENDLLLTQLQDDDIEITLRN